MYKLRLNMITAKHCIRVRYGETDAMKYVYYGNYALYLEEARVHFFRQLGISYKEIEENGIWLPVSTFSIKFLYPALYDEQLTIYTKIKELPTAKIHFDYEIFNDKNIKITEASTTLFFLDAANQKVVRCPQYLLELIKKVWQPSQ